MITSNHGGSYSNNVSWVDINGDGLADWVRAAASQTQIRLSLGNGQFDSISISSYENYDDNFVYVSWADIDGDGSIDWVAANDLIIEEPIPNVYIPDTSYIRFRLSNNNIPEVIKKITSSLNTKTEIEYTPLTDNAVYTKGTGSAYPETDLQGAMYVVSKVSVSDGDGGLRDTTYHYEGLRASVLRGSLGFASMSATDELLGMTTRTQYNQSYPFTGQVVRSVQTFDNGTASNESDDIVLSELEATFASIATHTGVETVASHTGTIFTYADTVSKKNYKLDGTLVSTVTTSNSYDTFGNPTSISVNTSGLDYDGLMESYITATTNSYTNDESNWFLGRLTRAEVTHTLPSGTSGTRSSEFSYDSASGLLIQEVVEPDTPALRLITDYGYDVYGNKVSVTVSGGQ